MNPRSKSSPKEAQMETVDTFAAAFSKPESSSATFCNEASSSCNLEKDFAADSIALHPRSRDATVNPSLSSFCRRLPEESMRVLEMSSAVCFMFSSI